MSATWRAWWRLSSHIASWPHSVERPEVGSAHLADHERVRIDGADALGELREHVGRRVVMDGVHRIEAEAVDPVVAHPELRVLERPLAHARLRVVERVAPRRLAESVGEVRPERAQRLVAGADVVVDDVEDHAEPLAVRGVDELRETLRPAVRAVRREGVEPVVAPPALAREGGDRHQLDRGHAELAERAEPRHHAGERASGENVPTWSS